MSNSHSERNHKGSHSQNSHGESNNEQDKNIQDKTGNENIHNTGWMCNRCNQKVIDGEKSGRVLLETPCDIGPPGPLRKVPCTNCKNAQGRNGKPPPICQAMLRLSNVVQQKAVARQERKVKQADDDVKRQLEEDNQRLIESNRRLVEGLNRSNLVLSQLQSALPELRAEAEMEGARRVEVIYREQVPQRLEVQRSRSPLASRQHEHDRYREREGSYRQFDYEIDSRRRERSPCRHDQAPVRRSPPPARSPSRRTSPRSYRQGHSTRPSDQSPPRRSSPRAYRPTERYAEERYSPPPLVNRQYEPRRIVPDGLRGRQDRDLRLSPRDVLEHPPGHDSSRRRYRTPSPYRSTRNHEGNQIYPPRR